MRYLCDMNIDRPEPIPDGVTLLDAAGEPLREFDPAAKVILTQAETKFVLSHPEDQRAAAGQHVLKLRERGRSINKMIRQGAQKESDKRATTRAKAKRRAKNKAARRARR